MGYVCVGQVGCVCWPGGCMQWNLMYNCLRHRTQIPFLNLLRTLKKKSQQIFQAERTQLKLLTTCIANDN